MSEYSDQEPQPGHQEALRPEVFQRAWRALIALSNRSASDQLKAGSASAFNDAVALRHIDADQVVGVAFSANEPLGELSLHVSGEVLSESFVAGDPVGGHQEYANLVLELKAASDPEQRGQAVVLMRLLDSMDIEFDANHGTFADSDPAFTAKLETVLEQWGLDILLGENNTDGGSLDNDQGTRLSSAIERMKPTQ